jgi:hypothetical protein
MDRQRLRGWVHGSAQERGQRGALARCKLYRRHIGNMNASQWRDGPWRDPLSKPGSAMAGLFVGWHDD